MNRLARRRQSPPEERHLGSLDLFGSFNGRPIWATPMLSMEGSKVDAPDGSFDAMVRQVHNTHDVIAAASAKRAQLVSQMSFRWRSLRAGENGRLWGDQSLSVLEHPNESQTMSALLRTASLHVDYAGTAFFHRVGDTVRLLNPGKTSVVLGSNLDADDPGLQRDCQVVGLWYRDKPMSKPEMIPADEVAIWCPEPDPISWWRGVSWVQSVLSEFVIDRAAHTHITKFFEHAATPQMVFSFDASQTKEQLEQFAEVVNSGHAGAANAYRNLFLGGGADAKVVGADLSQLDLKSVTGLIETRIAVRSQVPAVVLGIAEGLGGSALNAGNYSQTRRLWADVWFTPTANDLCAALERIVPPPDDATELAFDPERVMFLQDDQLDAATIRATDAQTMRNLLDGGYEATTVTQAVITGDWSVLRHTGQFSVQLQPPGSGTAPEPQRSEPSVVTFDRGAIQVTTPPVALPDQVHNVYVSPGAVNVAPAEVTVERSDVHVHVPEAGPVTKTVTRDADGNIATITEERG